jgi:ABC-type transport system involved in multi-copper enzyme maturation permease subunit
MSAIFAITINTVREAIRDRILIVLLLFSVVMIGGSLLIPPLTVGEPDRIIMDLGLASISLFSVLIAIFLSINLILREIDNRTIDTILTKPVHWYQFLLGKFLGVEITVGVVIILMSVIFAAVIFILGAWDNSILSCLVLIFFETVVVTSIAVFFSTFSSIVTGTLFTLAFYVIGHLSWSLLLLKERIATKTGRVVLEFFYYLLPNLELFNVKGKVIHGEEIGAGWVHNSIGYAIAYAAFLLILSAVIFKRKDIK